ncbi:MAG TPA: hypothetical protein VGD40_07035 [Chryseosolibacter sp.]
MRKIVVMFALAVGGSLSGCSSSENFSFHPHGNHIVKSSPSVSYIWEPEYYVYKNGKYRFVQGGYRPVVSRKKYFKRSLKGYTYRSDYAAAR